MSWCLVGIKFLTKALTSVILFLLDKLHILCLEEEKLCNQV